MPTMPYEGKLINSNKDSSITYIGYKSLADVQDSFLNKGSLIGATYYRPPSNRYISKSNEFQFNVVNAEEKIGFDKSTLSNAISPFSKETSFHFKSYTREYEGKLEAFTPSSNLSYSNSDDSILNAMLGSVASVLPFVKQIKQLPTGQTNTGVMYTGAAAEAVLGLQKSLSRGESPDKVSIDDNFVLSRGDNTEKEILSSLDKVESGDLIEVTSPYLANRDIINQLISAKKLGATVNVLMAPAYTTSPEREHTKKQLANLGINVYSEGGGTLVHQKNFVIKGRNVNLAVTGSDNYSKASSQNKTLDYSLLTKSKSSLQDIILEDNAFLKKELELLKATEKKSSLYAEGEFGFLYQTEYRTFSDPKVALLQAEPAGFIKPTKLSTAFFDRHINHQLPTYKGFSQTYEAITGIKASDAVTNMDAALGTPSAGHQLNRLLGMRIYVEGQGLLGSLVSGLGQFADYLSGHYAYQNDKALKKSSRGSIKKFTAQIAKEREAEMYKGGPLEQASNALYSAAQGFVVSTTGYGAVLAFQYGLTNFLEQGVKRTTELGAISTGLQRNLINQYLSDDGIAVMQLAGTYMNAPSNQSIGAHAAFNKALITLNKTEDELVTKKTFKLASITNRLRTASAGFMQYILPSILDFIVPANNLVQAQTAATNLIDVIGRPIQMSKGELINLKAQHSKELGNALEKLGQHIPLKLHYWVPQIRAQSGVVDIDAENPSLAKMFGENFLNQTIGAFVQTTEKIGQMLVKPHQHLDFVADLYKQSSNLRKQESLALAQFAKGNLSASGLEDFLKAQTYLGKDIAKYQPKAPALTQSLNQGIKTSKKLGRAVFGLSAALMTDFLLDQFVMRTQGANLLDQIRLTKEVRNQEGNILQVEFNATMPVATSLGAAAVSGLSTGYLLPTIYGVNKNSNEFLSKLADSRNIAGASDALKSIAANVDFDHLAGVRARFNYKAAFIGAVLGLTLAKAAFIGGATLANTLFPSKGVKTDPAYEVGLSKILSVLNKSKDSLYDYEEGTGLNKLSKDASTRSAVTRELLKHAVSNLSKSEFTLDKKSTGSSSYSVAFQLTNTSFLQTAILQRTDATKGITAYSFGMQLMPSLGLGLTPMLPFGLTTKIPINKDLNSTRPADADVATKNKLNAYKLDQEITEASAINQAVNLAFSPFNFLAYSPNSQITNTMLSLGLLQFMGAGLDYVTRKSTVPTNELARDFSTLGRGIKFANNLTAGVLKNTLALTDVLPRMVASGIQSTMGVTKSNSFTKMLGNIFSPISKNRYGLAAFAIGAALTDPILGIDPADKNLESLGTKHTERTEGAYTSPISRLITTGLFTAYATTAAKQLGIVGNASTTGVFTKLIPYAVRNQQILLDPQANNLRKSGARASLLAGLVFGTYLVGSITARIIGQSYGEQGLQETYKNVGILRLFSGVESSDYRKLAPGRNVITDTVADLVEKIPFIGESISKITGLYKDSPNLFLPVVNTPFGLTYREDGSVRPYTQNQSGTTDASISSYTKFFNALGSDAGALLENLEKANLDGVRNSEEITRAVLRGGSVRARQARATKLSSYALNAIDSPLLSIALNRRMHKDLNLLNQRASEHSFDEFIRQVKFGKQKLWAGGRNIEMPEIHFDFNEGIQIQFQQISNNKEIASGTGEYQKFDDMLTDSVINQRNVYTPNWTQSLTDLSNTYFKQGDKFTNPMVSSLVLGVVGAGVLGTAAYTTAFSGIHFISALEAVKYGKSLTALETDRFSSVLEFKKNVDIKISSKDASGKYLIDELGERFHNIEYKNSIKGSPSVYAIKFQDFGITAKEFSKARSNFVGALYNRLNINPHAIKRFGSNNFLFEELLSGGATTSSSIKHLQKQFGSSLLAGLNTQIGNTNLYDLIINQHQNTNLTAANFVGNLLNDEAYAPLASYAEELKANTKLSTKQKVEYLNLKRIQIERNILEEQVFLNRNNTFNESIDTTGAISRSGSLKGSLMSFAGAGTKAFASYLAFGKDAYSLTESTSYLLGGNERRRRQASLSIYETSVNLGGVLILQAGIAKALGKNTFSLTALALFGVASFGLNSLFGFLQKTDLGKTIKKAEAAPRNIVTTGLDIFGDIASNLTKYLFDPLNSALFEPVGKNIEGRYNKMSRSSTAEAIAAEFFLPNSIFKRNSFVPKRTAYGTQPFVIGDSKSYYTSKAQLNLESTKRLEAEDLDVHPFLIGKASGYKEEAFYNAYFDMRKRSAASALSNFNIQSSGSMSYLTYYMLKSRASSRSYIQFGRAFRRSKLERHDYIGTAISGLSTGNELARTVNATGADAGRIILDEVERTTNTVINPVLKQASIVKDFVSTKSYSIIPRISSTVNWLSTPITAVIKAPFQLFSKVPNVAEIAVNSIGGALKGISFNLYAGANSYDEAAIKTAERLTNVSKPIANITLGFVSATAKTGAYGLRSLGNLLDIIPITSKASTPELFETSTKEAAEIAAKSTSIVNYSISKFKIPGRIFQGFAKGTMHFAGAAMPVILDSLQLVPSTAALIGYNNENSAYSTRSQIVRMYESQGSALGATLGGIAASAARKNLFSSIAISLAGAFLGGKYGEIAGERDYADKNKTWATVNSIFSGVTLALSTAQTIANQLKKVKTYKNYVEVVGGVAKVFYTKEFRRDLRNADIQAYKAHTNNSFADYGRSEYSQLKANQADIQHGRLLREVFHEEHHLRQYDSTKGEFVPSNSQFGKVSPNKILKYYGIVDTKDARRFREAISNISKVSAQQQLADNPLLTKSDYRKIYKLELEANYASLDKLHIRISTNLTGYKPEEVIKDIYKLEKQLVSGRYLGRTPLESTANQSINRMYSAGSSTKASNFYLNQTNASNLVSSGFYNKGRLFNAGLNLLALPGAIYQAGTATSEVSRIQNSGETASAKQLTVALQNRGYESTKFVYGSSYSTLSSLVFKSPVALLSSAAYFALGQGGAKIPFTNLDFFPSFGIKEISKSYADHQYAVMARGEYAYDAGLTAGLSINAIRNLPQDEQIKLTAVRKVKDSLSSISKTFIKIASSSIFKTRGGKAGAAIAIGSALGSIAGVSGAYVLANHKDSILPVSFGVLSLGAIAAVLKFKDSIGSRITKSIDIEKLNRFSEKWVPENIRTSKSNFTKVFKLLADDIRLYNFAVTFDSRLGLPQTYNNNAGRELSKSRELFLKIISVPYRNIYNPLRAVKRSSELMLHGFINKLSNNKYNPLHPASITKKKSIWSKGISLISSGYNYAQESVRLLINKVGTLKPNLSSIKFGSFGLGRSSTQTGFFSRLFNRPQTTPALNITESRVRTPNAFMQRLLALPKYGAFVSRGLVNSYTIGHFITPKVNYLRSITGALSNTGANLTRSITNSINPRGLSNLVGNHVANSLIKNGVVGTTLIGLAAALDTKDLLEGSLIALTVNARSTKRVYQEAYVSAARGRAGLNITFGLIPKLGLLKGGLLIGIPYVMYEEQRAKQRGEELYEYKRNRPTNIVDNFADVSRDIVLPTARQLIISNFISKTIRPSSSIASRLRAVAAFGETNAARAMSGLASKSAKLGRGFLKGASRVAKFLSFALLPYDIWQVTNSKSPEEDRKTYGDLGGTVGNIVGSTIGAALGGFFGGLIGAPTGIGAAATATGGALVGAAIIGTIGDVIGRATGAFIADTKNYGVGVAFLKQGMDLFNSVKGVGDFFVWTGSGIGNTTSGFFKGVGEFIFGKPAAAAEMPNNTAMKRMVVTEQENKLIVNATENKKKREGKDWFSEFLSLAKLAVGSFAKKALTTFYNVAHPKAAPNTGNGSGSLGAGDFNGKVANYDELYKETRNFPAAHREDIASGLTGNVYAGRPAPLPITFTNSSSVTPEVRGKTIAYDANLMAFSDVVALKESSGATSIKSYGAQDIGNANSGRYQVTPKDISSLQGNFVGGLSLTTDPTAQDRGFVARMFRFAGERKPDQPGVHNFSGDRGGAAYLRFIQNGYKYEDYKQLVKDASGEWQSLRGNELYKADTGQRDDHLKRYYGSEEAGYRYLYQYFLQRRDLYLKSNAGQAPPQFTPAQADAINNPRTKPDSKKQPQQKPSTKKSPDISVTVGSKSKTGSVKAAPTISPKNRPAHQQVSLKIEEGKVVANLVNVENEDTHNSRANLPASYKTMGGMRVQMA